MMVNAIAELAARDERVRAAAAYRDRLRASFGSALAAAAARGEIDRGTARGPRGCPRLGPHGGLALGAHRPRRRQHPVCGRR